MQYETCTTELNSVRCYGDDHGGHGGGLPHHAAYTPNDAFLPVSPRKQSARLKVQSKWSIDHSPLKSPSYYRKNGFQNIELLKKKQQSSLLFDDNIKRGVQKSISYSDTLKSSLLHDDDDRQRGVQKSVSFKLTPSSSSEQEEHHHHKTAKKEEETKTNKNKKKKKKAYKVWDFGKAKKNFTPPPVTRETELAAVQIQRVARGGWQRMKFKIRLLQHKLDTRDERTAAALERVKERTRQRKHIIKKKLKEQFERENGKQMEREMLAAAEGQKIIAYLRKENKRLREKNQKIHEACIALNQNNDRLADANSSTGDSFSTLHTHAKEIKETNHKLNIIVPKYKEGVDRMKEAVDLRRQYCVTEHKIKVLYNQCVGQIITHVEDNASRRESDLVEEIVGYCMDLEGQDNNLELPPELPRNLADLLSADRQALEDSSDDEDYDEYTVNTID